MIIFFKYYIKHYVYALRLVKRNELVVSINIIKFTFILREKFTGCQIILISRVIETCLNVFNGEAYSLDKYVILLIFVNTYNVHEALEYLRFRMIIRA